MENTARVFLAPRHAGPAMGHHPWVYSGAIGRVEGSPQDGSWVSLHRSEDDKFIGHGLYNSKSQIRVRLYSWNEAEALGPEFFEERVQAAIELRMKVFGYSKSDSFRVINSEGDELSGLIVDKFGPYLSVQIGSLALSQRVDSLIQSLSNYFGSKAVRIRGDRAIAIQEGLRIEDRWIGEPPTEAFVIEQNGLKIWVDLRAGQKTGAYLDQRDNHREVAKFSAGKRVLDLFCYTGGFGLLSAKQGASEVVSVDSSAPAIALAQRNAEENGLKNIKFYEDEVEEFVKDQKDESFDQIILDPPRFASGKKDMEGALRKYFRVNEDALKKLKRGGIFTSCSCSGTVRTDDFLRMLSGVGRRLNRELQIFEIRGAAVDHPVLASCPETQYLKVVIGRLL